ncbi:MAG: VanZ family protein [Kiritimatiellia bacterium]
MTAPHDESQQRRTAAWLWVAAGSVLIFLSIPMARAVQGFLDRRMRPDVYLVAAAGFGLAGLAAALRRIVRTPGIRVGLRLGLLAAAVAAAVWLLRSHLQSSVEAIHFVEYAALGVLFFRAWRHHAQDPLVYPLALASLGLVAWADEFLQWLMPGRFWDFRDIRLNLLAGAVGLLFAASVVAPGAIRLPIARSSVRRLCAVVWVFLLALGCAAAATPARVDFVAARVPGLAFLRNKESRLAEYGHRHVDPDIGTFRSRLDLAALRRSDRERGAEIGAAFAAGRPLPDLRRYRRDFTVSADPFRFEFYRHLIQRDHYEAASGQYRVTDPARFRHHCTVAARENQLLEKYFPHALAAAGRRWDEARRERSAAGADWAKPYFSEVQNHLIVSAPAPVWLGALLALAGGVGWGYARWGKAPRTAAIRRQNPA